MTIGFARVSTGNQNPAHLIRERERPGGENIFADHCRGRQKDRPRLLAAFAFPRKGDRLAVSRLDRLGRNVPHLMKLVEDIEDCGCQHVSLNEELDTDTPGGKLVCTVFAAPAQFASDVSSERPQESDKAAKAAGRR